MVEVMPASFAQAVGYAASFLVLATFCFSNPVCFRLCGLMASIAFIAFGSLASVYPVLALHLVLLPVNGYHLARLLRRPRRRLGRADRTGGMPGSSESLSLDVPSRRGL